MKTPRRRIVIREVFRLMTGLIWIGCALPAFAGSSPDAARTIAIIQPRNVAAYQEAVEGFLRHLRVALPERFNTVIYETPESLYRALEAETSDASANSRIALIVTLGNSASNDVAKNIRDIPVVFSMVLEPENRPDPPANVVGASLNIPIELQFEMIASLLPSAKTVGIIYDPQKNAAVAQKHAEAAEASGMRIKAFPVTSPRDVPNALARIGKQADVLLGVVDETVYTSQSAGAIVKGYIAQMREIIPDADPTELMKMAVRMPDALKTERDDIDEAEWQHIQSVIDEALQNIINFRTDEGLALEKEFTQRIANIRALMHEAVSFDSERIDTVKTRLRTALDELEAAVDENRFEQELIFYLEKYDVTEERVRLDNHLNYFLETLAGSEANGRKLGFITQEMGREINTMGSKSNHAEMQKCVVMMKDELEKIKEQVLNVL